MRTVFFSHAAASIIVSGILLLVYTAIQQCYRTGANDPQIQMARDAVLALKNNKLPVEVVPAGTVDVEGSLSPFIQVYNEENKVVASNGLLGGNIPVIPAGVLEKAKQDGEYLVTWQPSPAARIAAVVVYTNLAGTGYVVAGRALVEIEKRETALRTMVFACWLCCMGVVAAHAVLQGFLKKKDL
ncbi:MAG TPA: hypothetical protein VHB48_11015 [Chitinophagaceae bacterium]|nr:hypothetical protein [Chitinophagaceae bacterium]